MADKLLGFISLSLLVIMIGLAFYAAKYYSQNLLAATLGSDAVPNSNVQVLDAINEQAFMLSYGKNTPSKITINQNTFDITVNETNYSLPYVWNYRMVSGGFFYILLY